MNDDLPVPIIPTDSPIINRIDIKEFRRIGFLQEVNRQFFHPLGLALEVVTEDCIWCREGVISIAEGQYGGNPRPCPHCDGDGVTERLGGIWDYRDDPEGITYGEDQMSEAKRICVKAERDSHIGARLALMKGVVQSVPRDS